MAAGSSPLSVSLLSSSLLRLLLVAVAILAAPETASSGDKLVPLVIWHGMGDSCCYSFGAGGFRTRLEELLPGLYVNSLQFGSTPVMDSFNSFFLDANVQIRTACEELSSDPKLKDGFNAIGFSQGSQFLRALIQRCGNVTVHNLISMGGQHQGVYGFPQCVGETSYFCHFFRQMLSLGAYLSFIQDYYVQAQYWHDPYNEENYRENNMFLPDINQENVFRPEYKERLSNISNFVMVKFLYDNQVQPRATQWFGFYKEGQSMETYSLFESKIYQQDLLGLKHLHESGRLHFVSTPGRHMQLTPESFNDHVLPYINRTYKNVREPLSTL